MIHSNKAWDTAEPVRRDWLATFATRKTAPKGSSAFIACVVTEHPEVVADIGGSKLAAEWFGLKHEGYGYGNGWSALIEKATESRAQVIALCRLLASLEKGTDRQSWRRVMPATADYLTFIAANGYDLSDVEKRAAVLVKPMPARRSRPKAAPASPVSEATEPSVDDSTEADVAPTAEADVGTDTDAATPAA